MNKFYNTGFIPAREIEARLKQGLMQQEVANACAINVVSCNQKSLYPVQQVIQETPPLPPRVDLCARYVSAP
jgi:hypothetical protein